MRTARSGPEAFEILERLEPDTIPGEKVCQILKADPRFAFLPVILVTAFDDGMTTKQRALENAGEGSPGPALSPWVSLANLEGAHIKRRKPRRKSSLAPIARSESRRRLLPAPIGPLKSRR